MDVREFLEQARSQGLLDDRDRLLDLDRPLAGALRIEAGRVALFHQTGRPGKLVTGLVSDRRLVAMALGTSPGDVAHRIGNAKPDESLLHAVSQAPFMEHLLDAPDLSEVLPLARFYAGDGGPYTSAFVFSARDERGLGNLSFHRMMFLGGRRFAVRLVPRHLHAILERSEGKGRVVAFCGLHPALLLAAAWSGAPDLDEMALAPALAGRPMEYVDMDGIRVPAHAEVVLDGRFTGELVEEGPFVDLTGTYDVRRRQPVFEVDRAFVREDFHYHAILPAGPEHMVLMGLPRQAAVLAAARAACPTVVDAQLTAGGAGWLHAVVSMRQAAAGRAVNVGLAALAAHASLKRVVVVDDDIDIQDPQAVEWALATRLRPDRDVHVISGARGSSLDPSRDRNGGTAKWILDATIPPGADRDEFLRAETVDERSGHGAR